MIAGAGNQRCLQLVVFPGLLHDMATIPGKRQRPDRTGLLRLLFSLLDPRSIQNRPVTRHAATTAKLKGHPCQNEMVAIPPPFMRSTAISQPHAFVKVRKSSSRQVKIRACHNTSFVACIPFDQDGIWQVGGLRLAITGARDDKNQGRPLIYRHRTPEQDKCIVLVQPVNSCFQKVISSFIQAITTLLFYELSLRSFCPCQQVGRSLRVRTME